MYIRDVCYIQKGCQYQNQNPCVNLVSIFGRMENKRERPLILKVQTHTGISTHIVMRL